MYWNEEKKPEARYQVPDDIVDLAFAITCPRLPIEHAHELSTALMEALPWLEEDEDAGIHLIHGAESGNGWYRPEDPVQQVLHLSRRARMRIRIANRRIEDAQALTGKTLDISGHELVVGKSAVQMLSTLPTQFSRYVICPEDDSEEVFLDFIHAGLLEMEIDCRKILCGKTHVINMPDRPVFTRSVMLADLEPEESVRLQQRGLGDGRKFGCGLFSPHKGIKAVREENE